MLTPGQSIKRYCYWCCNEQRPVKSHCDAVECVLYEKRGRTALKRIRARCIDCSGYLKGEVKTCRFKECVLWNYRMGRNSVVSDAAKKRYHKTNRIVA